MSNAINANLNGKLLNRAEFDLTEENNEWYKIKRDDCVQLISELENESIGLSVFSPPFAELYTYSSHIEDMGNESSEQEYIMYIEDHCRELRELIDKLYRTTTRP